MKLKILGKYGPFAINGQGTSSYLIESNKSCVLLDVGSSSVSKMLSQIDINNLKFVVLSHLHFDHVSDIFVLSYAVSFLKLDKKLKVYMCDDGSKIAELIKSIEVFDIVNIKTGEIYNDSGFTFSFYKMAHPVLSHGIKISNGFKTLSYTGDTTINGDIDNLVKGSDLILADGCFLEKDYSQTKPHMSVKQVCNIANNYKIKTILTHISFNYLDKDVLKEIDSDFVSLALEGDEYYL